MNELLLISATIMSGLVASIRGESVKDTDYALIRRIAREQAALLIQETLRAQGKLAGN
jgi:hypothetical protein